MYDRYNLGHNYIEQKIKAQIRKTGRHLYVIVPSFWAHKTVYIDECDCQIKVRLQGRTTASIAAGFLRAFGKKEGDYITISLKKDDNTINDNNTTTTEIQRSYYYIHEVIDKPICSLKTGGRIIYVPKHWLGKKVKIDGVDEEFIPQQIGSTAKINVTKIFGKATVGRTVRLRLK